MILQYLYDFEEHVFVDANVVGEINKERDDDGDEHGQLSQFPMQQMARPTTPSRKGRHVPHFEQF